VNFGNLGAAVGGASTGMQLNQQAQMRDLQIKQAQQQMRDDAILSGMSASGYQDWLAQQAQPMPQSPPPGQASVPMMQPGQAPAQAPIPRWQPVPTAPAAQMPVGAAPNLSVQLPRKPSRDPLDPATFESYLQTRAQAMQQQGASGRAIAGYVANERAKFADAMQMRRQAEKDALEQRNIESQMAAREKGDWSEPRQLGGVWVQTNEKTGQTRKITAPPGAGGGLGGNAGHFNQMAAQQVAELKPIGTAQQRGAEMISMLDSGNPASTVQVQKDLVQWLNAARSTNQQYGDNKSFGNIEQRFANSLNRFLSGKYSADDRKMIKDMINQMNKSVFEPARKNINDVYKKRAKTFGFDPELMERQDPFGGTGQPAAPSGGASNAPAPPAGFTIQE